MKRSDLASILGDKPFPSFKDFVSTMIDRKNKHFTLREGIRILDCYSKGIKYVDDRKIEDFKLKGFEKEIKQIFHTEKYTPIILVRKLKDLDKEFLYYILKGHKFPKEEDLLIYFEGGPKKKNSLHDGILILKDYSQNIPATKSYIEKERLRKSIIQSENLINKDKDGLLGIQLPRHNKKKKKVQATVRSVWTVKK
jgi:hypothetical protein